MALHLLIRGGKVYNGTGAAAQSADVGVTDGVITQIGKITDPAERTIDADGAMVTPGFVDIHTHYDAQATWASRLKPSSDHGVTTAVMGNCGVGFAPVRPADHDMLIELMEGVEDIPEVVMKEGLPWEWETFDDYMDFLSDRHFDMDLGAQLPHAAMRVYVMGERGANREPANPDDIAQMRKIAASAIRSGALGFSTSRWLHHKSSTGEHTPSLNAGADELIGIAMGLRDAGGGVLQLISEFEDMESEFLIFREMARQSGRPVSMSLSEGLNDKDWRDVLTHIEKANEEGLEFRGQIAPRAIGAILGLTASLTPFTSRKSFREVAGLAFEEKLQALKDPERRKKILAEAPDPEFARLDDLLDMGNWVWEMADVPDYEPAPEDTLAARAKRAGHDPMEFVYDRMIANNGQTLFYSARTNYEHGNFDACREMLVHKDTVMGLGDGGAHVGIICDASFPTTLLAHWGRDRGRGDRIDLATLVKLHTSDTARAVGLSDRGVIAEGMKADINIIDFENLKALTPKIVHDLPAGGGRFQQKAEGYLATIINGPTRLRERRSHRRVARPADPPFPRKSAKWRQPSFGIGERSESALTGHAAELRPKSFRLFGSVGRSFSTSKMQICSWVSW